MCLPVALYLSDGSLDLLASARVNLRFAGSSAISRNSPYLLFQLRLPHQGGIKIVALENVHLQPDDFVLDQMAKNTSSGCLSF